MAINRHVQTYTGQPFEINANLKIIKNNMVKEIPMMISAVEDD
jgi:hypothetical protein